MSLEHKWSNLCDKWLAFGQVLKTKRHMKLVLHETKYHTTLVIRPSLESLGATSRIFLLVTKTGLDHVSVNIHTIFGPRLYSYTLICDWPSSNMWQGWVPLIKWNACDGAFSWVCESHLWSLLGSCLESYNVVCCWPLGNLWHV